MIRYTKEFERYWVLAGLPTNLAGSQMRERVKQTAYKAWMAGRRSQKKRRVPLW